MMELNRTIQAAYKLALRWAPPSKADEFVVDISVLIRTAIDEFATELTSAARAQWQHAHKPKTSNDP